MARSSGGSAAMRSMVVDKDGGDLMVEQPARIAAAMQNAKCRMQKRLFTLFLHSAFCVLHSCKAELLERRRVIEVVLRGGEHAVGVQRGEERAQPPGHRVHLQQGSVVASQAVDGWSGGLPAAEAALCRRAKARRSTQIVPHARQDAFVACLQGRVEEKNRVGADDVPAVCVELVDEALEERLGVERVAALFVALAVVGR